MSENNPPLQGSRLFPRVISVIAILLVFVLGLAALPIFIGAERMIASLGGWLTGYEVTVRGGAAVRLRAEFTAPLYIEAEDIVVRLPTDRFTPVDSPPIARVARLEAAVNPWPLFVGRIGFTRLALARPGIRIDKNADGLTNWSTADKPSLGANKIRQNAAWRDITIDTLHITNGTLRFTDDRLARDLSFDNLNIEAGLSSTVEGRVFRLRGDASHRGDPVYSEMEIRRLDEFHAGARVPFAVTLDATPGQIHARGTIAGRNQPAITADVDLDFDAPQALVRMLPMVPSELADQTSLRVRIDVKGGRIGAQIRSLILGKSDVSGQVSVDLDDRLPQLDVTLDAGAIDVSHLYSTLRLLDLVGSDNTASPVRFGLGGGARLKWSRLIMEDVELGAGAAGLSWRVGEPNLAIDVPSVPVFGGAISGHAEMTRNEGKTAVSLSLSGSDINVADILSTTAGIHGVAGRLHGNADILAVGETLDELISATSGGGRLSLTEGVVFGSKLQLAVDKRLRTLNLARASMDFTVEGGLMRSDELLMDFEVGHVRAGLEWDTVGGGATIIFQPSPVHEGADGPVTISGTLRDLLVAR